MKSKIFSIYDSKALAFGVPFFMSSNGLAVRAYTDLVNDAQSSVNKHPGDYILYVVGEFDDSNAKFESFVPPIHLANGADLVENAPGRSFAPPLVPVVKDSNGTVIKDTNLC